MVITLNGSKEELRSGTTLTELIASKGLEPNRIVIEYNLEILKREDWDKVSLKENDTIEILRFVGGG
ncbi:MAG: sulfur carrier protein ThiS [Clostridia bacterium]|nr:sulfur carrier protein ThiS [Clostridia bacterium]